MTLPPVYIYIYIIYLTHPLVYIYICNIFDSSKWSQSLPNYEQKILAELFASEKKSNFWTNVSGSSDEVKGNLATIFCHTFSFQILHEWLCHTYCFDFIHNQKEVKSGSAKTVHLSDSQLQICRMFLTRCDEMKGNLATNL